jgi:hypothetical protein
MAWCVLKILLQFVGRSFLSLYFTVLAANLETLAACCSQKIGMPVKQIIEGRYIEREKLIKLLRETFGEGQFHVRVGGSCSGSRDLQIRLLNVLCR